jgi:ligand-binding sensor domain-containing protein/signal transduction histidine kinase
LRSFSTCRDGGRVGHLVRGALAVLAISASPAAALDPERLVSQYAVERWGADRGYPGGAIHGIAQSADGDLWLATEKGLVRFDGITFSVVPPPDGSRGARRAVLSVASDGDGRIWARLHGPLLLRQQGGTFVPVAAWDAQRTVVTSLQRARDGAMLVAPLGDGVVLMRGERATVRVPQADMPSSFVVAMTETADGAMWIGTRDTGVLRVRAGRVAAIRDELPDRKVNALASDGRDGVWVATDRGVARWTGTAIVRQPLPVAPDVAARSLARDRDGNVWVALGAAGVARIAATGRATLLAWDALRFGEAGAVFEDREGTLWIGTSRGLQCLRASTFATLSATQGLHGDGAGPIAVDAAGRLWMGPPGGGLAWFAEGAIHVVRDSALDRDVVYSIAPDTDGVWVARQRGGLSRVRLAGTRHIVESITQRRGLAQDSAYAVHRARDGAVWVGTLNAGVSCVRAGHVTTITTADGLASNTVTTIADTPDGRVWLGTPLGLSVLDGGRSRRVDRQAGLPSNDVTALLADDDGTMWVGTTMGLAVVRGATARPIQTSALTATAVAGLARDAAGYMWIATGESVLRVPATRLLAGTVRDEDVRHFDLLDGLASTEGLRRHRSVVADGSRVWLSLARGLSRVDVPALDRGTVPRRVRVDAVIADDQVLPGDATREAPARTRRLTFTFDDDSLTLPQRTRFRYRLDGYDAEWSSAGGARAAAYTNLSPRTYTFRVVAADAHGAWGPEQRVVVRLRPAYWQTPWFAGGIATGGLGLVWAGYRWRVRHLSRRLAKAFEERLAERTLVAQDLHDTLLQGCLAASMQLHLAAERIDEDAPARPAVQRVLHLLTRVVDDGRAAVRGLRADVADDLERALARVPGELAPDGRVAVRVIVEGLPRAWHPVARDEAYRIGREAIANALRHADAARIDVTVSYGARAVRLSVRDDGRGMDDAVQLQGRDGHWGLAGMRERAEAIGASIRVLSREGAGTEIELVVPAATALVAELRPARRHWWHSRALPREPGSPETDR